MKKSLPAPDGEGNHKAVSDGEREIDMAFSDRVFEQVINWRLANNLFRNPEMRLSMVDICEIPESPLTVFLPQDKNFDVRQVRDWLHDPDNNTAGYKMVGCFRDSVITGIKFLFESNVDAVYFRLSFSGIAVASPK